MKAKLLLGVLLVFTLATSITLAQDTNSYPAYDVATSPVDVLASYYNAISRGEYWRAYNYWGNHPQTYVTFANGFSDTLSVQLIVQPPTILEGAAGSIYASIPTVVIAEHQDNTQHIYSGCFVTRKTNQQTPDMPEDTWHIYSGDLKEVADMAAIPTLLAESCQP